MPKKQANGQPQCEICFTFFQDPFSLAEHCLGTGHQAHQCCHRCVKWFGSTQSLAQHRASKHENLRAVMPSPSIPLVPETGYGPASSTALGPYHFRDRDYKRLWPPDMHVIHYLSLVACHSQDRLKKEGYFMPDDLFKRSRVAKKDTVTRRQCLPTPRCDPWFPKRKAIAFDCEMAGVEGGRSEVVSICIVDLFTGEVLINSLVKPREPIVEWRSNIHGITPPIMSIAVARKQTLDSWEAAREELWKHVNEDTVMVGQSLQFDLKALRVLHNKIVDTAILTADAVFGGGEGTGRRWGLQSMCEELLHLRIRQGSGVHDGLEDIMAARELALRCLCDPVGLQQWADKARKSFQSEREMNRKRNQRLAARVRRTAGNGNGGERGGYSHQYDRSNCEILRWENVMD